MSNKYANSFPAISTSDDYLDRAVLQGHVDYCAANGHATHTVDGVIQPRCPRCGETLPTEAHKGDKVAFTPAGRSANGKPIAYTVTRTLTREPYAVNDHALTLIAEDGPVAALASSIRVLKKAAA